MIAHRRLGFINKFQKFKTRNKDGETYHSHLYNQFHFAIWHSLITVHNFSLKVCILIEQSDTLSKAVGYNINIANKTVLS